MCESKKTVESVPNHTRKRSVLRLVDAILKEGLAKKTHEIVLRRNIDGSADEKVFVYHNSGDGVLRPLLQYKTSMHSSVVARLRIMGGLGIAENRKSQMGEWNDYQFSGCSMPLLIYTTIEESGLVVRVQYFHIEQQ